MIIAILAFLGLCFGSFVNALVFRLHWQSKNQRKPQATSHRYSIAKGRSMCPKCEHQLMWYDNIPVLSWIGLGGKCRYCKKSIHWQYPAVELLTAIFFVASYIFWPSQLLSPISYLLFYAWLAILIGLVALIVYDLRWMLLPNKIIFPLYFFAFAFVVLEAVKTSNFSALTSAALGVLVGGGIFYTLFQLSDGHWIGGGDVKLGFLLGALVGSPMYALMVLFLASLLGCLVTLPLLAASRVVSSTRIPFGPFLVVAGIVVVLFGPSITNWYLDALMFD